MSSDLRSKVIRLAHENSALRPHLLPLLKEASFTRQDRVGYAAATIAGDYRYYTELSLYWTAPVLTIVVASKSPIGGMDGPGGAHDLEEQARAVVKVDGPEDLKRAMAEIKRLIREDAVLSKYAKQKDFVWGAYGAPPRAWGLNLGLLSAALFPVAQP